MKYIIKTIVRFLSPNEEDIEIVEFELESLSYEFVNIIVAMVIGFVAEKTLVVAIFISFFCFLRQYSGGHHFDTHLKCFIGFEILIITVIFFDYIYIDTIIKYLVTLTSAIFIYVYSPLEHKNNPFTLMMKHNNRRKSVLSLIILLLIYLILNILCIDFYDIITYVLFSDAILMIAGIISGDCVNV
jgi:accessory gene regulator B